MDSRKAMGSRLLILNLCLPNKVMKIKCQISMPMEDMEVLNLVPTRNKSTLSLATCNNHIASQLMACHHKGHHSNLMGHLPGLINKEMCRIRDLFHQPKLMDLSSHTPIHQVDHHSSRIHMGPQQLLVMATLNHPMLLHPQLAMLRKVDLLHLVTPNKVGRLLQVMLNKVDRSLLVTPNKDRLHLATLNKVHSLHLFMLSKVDNLEVMGSTRPPSQAMVTKELLIMCIMGITKGPLMLAIIACPVRPMEHQ